MNFYEVFKLYFLMHKQLLYSKLIICIFDSNNKKGENFELFILIIHILNFQLWKQKQRAII